ncbi:unnamed protein product [Aureobasidium uvarum]|uniref:Alpha-ketoglutarate-dependent sulfonate dioxygenase n=1 Tax=Aureobasidium uvarum TaxID=2773716 RepID=A0A9N8KM43_9PEZI|nr:unnamed protein product [Aureobasidium uvarum]
MGRLSRAFSRVKETDKEKEANVTTTVDSVEKSPSPPPPAYEDAGRQQHNVQLFTPSASSLPQLDPDLPSPEDCVAHLKLLECFYRLKQKIASTEGLFGISCDVVGDFDQSTPQKDTQKEPKNETLTLLAEKRWQVYVSRAVERFARWRYSLEPNPNYYTLNQAISSKGQTLADRVNPETAKPLLFDAENLPPIAYLEDCAREGRMRLWHTPFPLLAVADHFDASDYHYEVAKQTIASFREQTGLDWDNLDGPGHTNVECHFCLTQNTAPWTTYGEASAALGTRPQESLSDRAAVLGNVQALFSTCHGFADKEFTLTCQQCNSKITHDSLCVGKLRKDLIRLVEKDVILPGGILGREGLPGRVGKVSDPNGWSYFAFPSKLMKIGRATRILDLGASDMQMASVREVIEDYLLVKELVKQAKHHKASSKVFPEEGLALRRMMSRYWENSSVFAINLVGAVIRQGDFVEKMHNIDWLHSPALSNTIPRLIRKYSRFIAIISRYSMMAVPTLDVDLAWHTHQLSPSRYLQYTVAQSRTFIDHDDKVVETKLTDAFAVTSKIYQKLYNEPYSECTCWYCEAVRESHTSTASRIFRSNVATAAENLHATYDDRVVKRLAELEKAYDKACQRADKKGKQRPKRDDYYYSDAYGYPVYIPAYAPYYGAMPYTPVVYPINPGCMALETGAVETVVPAPVVRLLLRDRVLL